MRMCLIIGTLLTGLTLAGCGGKETDKGSPAKDAPAKQPNKGSGTRSNTGSDTTTVDAGVRANQGSVTR